MILVVGMDMEAPPPAGMAVVEMNQFHHPLVWSVWNDGWLDVWVVVLMVWRSMWRCSVVGMVAGLCFGLMILVACLYLVV